MGLPAPVVADRVPFVWLAQRHADADARRVLDAWARTRGLTLGDATNAGDVATAPAPAPAPGSTRDGISVSDDVERSLALAREALVALDADGADRALSHAEEALHGAPELAQAAWLMAEVHRGWSARFARIEPRDPERAARAWRRAAALDGGRVAGIGELAADGGEPEVTVRMALEGAKGASGYELRIDGAPRANAFGGAIVAVAGEHQVTVFRTADGALAWAGWLAFAPSASLTIHLPEAAPCTLSDLAAAALSHDAAVDASAVRCPRWVAAVTASEAGVVRVALCSASSCEPLARFPALADAAAIGGSRAAQPAAHGGFPRWATWSLVGVGVAALATGTVLAATGAFRSTPPAETRFVGGGVHASSLVPAF